MKERKYVKFRVDMYDDTKFKIIDMKPERDLIHYIWTRIVTLAGKVNLEGELFLSKNIPYTAETLAIEFNRDIFQVKSALNTLVELEMIELIENRIYRVKNFTRHQNIKVTKKDKIEHKEVAGKDEESNYINKDREDVNKYTDNGNLENKIYDDSKTDIVEDDFLGNKELKKDKKVYKCKDKTKSRKKADNITDEVADDILGGSFIDGELKNGGTVMDKWDFAPS